MTVSCSTAAVKHTQYASTVLAAAISDNAVLAYARGAVIVAVLDLSLGCTVSTVNGVEDPALAPVTTGIF